LRKLGKNLKKEKARCVKLYPDWTDDEFNMLDNKFIWGCSNEPGAIPSFCTWDDAYVYYNRATKKYYMTIDLGFYDINYSDELGRIAILRLAKIKEAFEDFLSENGIDYNVIIFPYENPELEADSLAELYVKFYIMYLGYDLYTSPRHRTIATL
jgi:hypothetical protein